MCCQSLKKVYCTKSKAFGFDNFIDIKNKSYYTVIEFYKQTGSWAQMNAGKGKMHRKSDFMVMLIFVLLGIVIALQVKSVAKANDIKSQNTTDEIKQYEKTIQELEQKISLGKETKDALKSRYDSEMAYLYNNEKEFYELYKKYEFDIDTYKFYAGLTNVSGPGIDIGLDDAPVRYESVAGLLVHDIYLNETVNILRAAGAQAISINGERIAPMSEMLCMGPSIRVNNTKLFAPYHIEAIGNPQELLDAFKSSTIYAIMIKENLIVDPVLKENIVIKKYSKSYMSSINLLEVYE